MKILLRALCAGLAISSLPAMASVTYQDIVSAATNPDDLSRQALVTIFGDVVTNPLSTSDLPDRKHVLGVQQYHCRTCYRLVYLH